MNTSSESKIAKKVINASFSGAVRSITEPEIVGYLYSTERNKRLGIPDLPLHEPDHAFKFRVLESIRRVGDPNTHVNISQEELKLNPAVIISVLYRNYGDYALSMNDKFTDGVSISDIIHATAYNVQLNYGALDQPADAELDSAVWDGLKAIPDVHNIALGIHRALIDEINTL